jgi:replicative DNA helicase
MQDVNQTPLDALHKFRRVAISTIDVNDNQAVNPTDVADKVMRIVDERAGQTNAVIGYSFGTAMPVLNSLMSGIQKGHQYVIAANQSVGKSVFALNLINPIAIDQQVPGLWIAQEMVEEDLVMRLMSIRTGINNNRIQSGKMTPEEYLMYRCALQDYARGNLYIRKPLSGTIDEILALIEEYKFKHGIEFIVWDYMQLVVASRDQRGMSTTEVLGYASNVMTNRVAGSMNLASICIAQLNRSEYKKGEVREGESIGGAYKIVQDASDVITLAEKTDKQIEEFGKDRGNRFISVDKRRGGASDVLLHGNLDKHDKISLKFTECVKEPEAIGFTKSLAV